MATRKQYDQLFEGRAAAANAEQHYRDLIWKNRAKYQPLLVAARAQYDAAQVAIDAFAAANPAIVADDAAEHDAAVDRLIGID